MPTPEDYLVRNMYRNASNLLSNVVIADNHTLASLLLHGMRMGIALHFKRPEAAETILQSLRIANGTVTYDANKDVDMHMIELILGKDIWSTQTPVPLNN